MKLTYLKHYGNFVLLQVDVRFLHKFFQKNAESLFFDKDKPAWQLIISPVKLLIVVSLIAFS